MKKISLLFSFLLLSFVISCSPDDSDGADQGINFNVPSNYTFEREGSTNISYTGQTARLKMGAILHAQMLVETNSEQDLLNLFRNENEPALFTSINSTNSIVEKTAAANGTPDLGVITVFEGFFKNQADVIFDNWLVSAEEGIAGLIPDGSATRYVNEKGLEYDQAYVLGLLGAMALDQIVNDYLTTEILDDESNRTDNDAGKLVSGKNYTQMEHYWDEGFGYLYGLEDDAANPKTGVDGDVFLNKYLKRVNDDPDYAGISSDVYKAFTIGRAAIVAKDYAERDKQADIIQKKLSSIVAIRSIYYLEQGKAGINVGDFGGAFHDLSEGYGFIYSLQFTRNPNTNLPYFSSIEVDDLLDEIYGDFTYGFWDVTPAALTSVSNKIAARFGLSVAQAGS